MRFVFFLSTFLVAGGVLAPAALTTGLLIARTLFDADLSWWQVFAPVWIPSVFGLLMLASAWMIYSVGKFMPQEGKQ